MITSTSLPGRHVAQTLIAVSCLVGGSVQARVVEFTGMCDASGAIPLSATRFAVADDEDNVLRIYDADRGGAPLATVEISQQLGLPTTLNKKGEPKRAPETDMEAATVLNGRAYWITSFGRNSKGKEKQERLQFFSTNVPAASETLRVTALAHRRFFNELLDAPSLQPFNLRAAAARAPKTPGGLNIEGLTAMTDGRLLIGFRNPVPQGLALLVPLNNPEEVMDGKPARFGAPVRLDLGGLGVRSLTLRDGRYLIVAGHYDEGAAAKLYAWDGTSPPQVLNVDLGDINPEGFFSSRERTDLLLLSDDGSRMVEGRECKRLKDAGAKRFRGLWLTLPGGSASGL